MSQRVVITGVGIVSPLGAGIRALAEGLAPNPVTTRPPAEPAAPVSPLTQPAEGGPELRLDPKVGWSAKVPADALASWLSRAESRRMSHPSKLAVAVARMALARRDHAVEAAGGTALDTSRLAVVLATVFGASSITESLIEAILLRGPETASPFDFAESVANAPTAQAARILGARGPNITLCQREAGVLTAVHRASREIATGRAPAALAGSVDEVTPTLLTVLQRFGALARSAEEDGSEAPIARPFDRNRTGFVVGEGSTVLLLEEQARAPEESTLAEVLATGSAFDPTAGAAFWGHGSDSLARSLTHTLERAHLTGADIDVIIAGASGAIEGDRLEAETLRTTWGDIPLPPIIAPKAVTGELGGAQLATALLALDGATFGPTAGFVDIDPKLGITPWGGGALPSKPETVLATAFGAGGATSFLVLGRPRGDAS